MFVRLTGPHESRCSSASTSRSARARMRPCLVRSKYRMDSRCRWSNTSLRIAWIASTPTRVVIRSSNTVIVARNTRTPTSASTHRSVPATSPCASGPSMACLTSHGSTSIRTHQTISMARPRSSGPLWGAR